jgi:hypothetical protein
MRVYLLHRALGTAVVNASAVPGAHGGEERVDPRRVLVANEPEARR